MYDVYLTHDILYTCNKGLISPWYYFVCYLVHSTVHLPVVHLSPHAALVAAGRTISPSDSPSDHKKDSKVLTLEASGEIAALEVKEIESDKKAELPGENFANPWMGKIKISADHDDSEVVLRKGARSSNASSDKSDPLRRIGSPLELIRTGSPLVRTTSPMDDMRRKARASVISIASNISNRFRKSVDLNEEEVEKLVSTSTIIDSSSDSNSEEGRCMYVCIWKFKVQHVDICSF